MSVDAAHAAHTIHQAVAGRHVTAIAGTTVVRTGHGADTTISAERPNVPRP
ncbi:hypothetical protein AB0D57_30330 [Streptomyces sp. NPDC048275]|uniref:hypothetical protein n=1 Tax=Streptomyces sp. NPDC048275 TaxID=3155629 RepID=UPI0033F08AE5